MRLINSRRPVPARMNRLYYRRVYLHSEWWLKFREGWWRRHPNAVCKVCGRPRGTEIGESLFTIYSVIGSVISVKKVMPIDLHHKTYERLWRERDDDVEPICRECHRRHRHQ